MGRVAAVAADGAAPRFDPFGLVSFAARPELLEGDGQAPVRVAGFDHGRAQIRGEGRADPMGRGVGHPGVSLHKLPIKKQG